MMKRSRLFFRLLAALSLSVLSACSVIKSWFPDKGRDYQFTSEIPELVIPADLQPGSKAKENLVASRSSSAQSTTAQAEDTSARAASSRSSRAKKPEPEAVATETPVEAQPITASSTSASSLQIDQTRAQAARLVAKALSRQKLEIVERNVDKGFFYVKFDPNAVPATDKDWIDEYDFVFGEDPSHEEEYRINMQQIAPQLTEVTVEDTAGKTLSTPAANTLLRLITEAIKQDVPENDEQAAGGKPAGEDKSNAAEKSGTTEKN